MLITRSDDGYFGLTQSLAGVFGEAVASPSAVQKALLAPKRSSSGTTRFDRYSARKPAVTTSADLFADGCGGGSVGISGTVIVPVASCQQLRARL